MPAYLTRFLTGTALSILVFGTLSFLTVLRSVLWPAFNYRLEIGFPLPYYYQFLVEGGMQHGTSGLRFWVDCGLSWLVVTGLYLLRQKQRNA